MGHGLGTWAALLPSHLWSGWHWRLPCKSSSLHARAWLAAVSRAAHDGDVGGLGGLARAAFASGGLLLRVWGSSGRHRLPDKNLRRQVAVEPGPQTCWGGGGC